MCGWRRLVADTRTTGKHSNMFSDKPSALLSTSNPVSQSQPVTQAGSTTITYPITSTVATSTGSTSSANPTTRLSPTAPSSTQFSTLTTTLTRQASSTGAKTTAAPEVSGASGRDKAIKVRTYYASSLESDSTTKSAGAA